MKYFINKYSHEGTASFSRFITPIVDGELPNVVVCGKQQIHGFLASFDDNGDPIFEKKYETGTTESSFVNGVQCPNGDYLMYGWMERSGNNRAYNMLIRVSSEGKVIWSKRIHSATTRNSVRMTSIGEEEYIVVAWHNVSGSLDDIEISKFNGQGAHLGSVKLDASNDDQISNVFAWQEGFVVVGNSSAGPSWDAFVAYYSKDLELIWSRMLGTSATDHIQVVTTGANNELILVGTTRKNSGNGAQTILIPFYGNEKIGTIINAPAFNMSSADEGSRQAIKVGNYYYILGYQNSPRKQYVLCLDLKLNYQWSKFFDIEEDFELVDMIHRPENELWLSGYFKKANKAFYPLLIKTDLELTTCKTIDWEGVEENEVEITVKNWNANSIELEYEVEDLDIIMEDSSLSKTTLCPTKEFEWKENPWIQSPYLNLRTAGSVGSESSEGFHLRWLFGKELGEYHLPKGNLASTTANYNKPDDYVCLYRMPYTPNTQERISLDFGQEKPIFVHPLEHFWVYKLSNNSIFYLHFRDSNQYLSVLSNYNPLIQSEQFLQAYGAHLLEVEIKDSLAFSVEFQLSNMNNGFLLKAETWSVEGAEPLAERQISARKSFSISPVSFFRIESENIRSVKFIVNNGTLGVLHFETYRAFFDKAVKQNSIVNLGAFSLTTDDNETHKRLEDPAKYIVNNHWKRFNDGRKVQTSNYIQKWASSDWGLKIGVQKYIDLSNNPANPKANLAIAGLQNQDGSNDFSLLDLLNIASVDFHIARMLGLGHIDSPEGVENQRFIYMAEYVSPKTENDGSVNQYQHLFLSPPTSKQDLRLPQPLKPDGISYGLQVQNGTSQPFQLTDVDGYTPDGQTRYIRLFSKLQTAFLVSNGFFNPSTEFCTIDFTPPVTAGIEYRKLGESNWRPLEIAHHDEFPPGFDKNNPPATYETPVIPFDNDSNDPLFIHKELEEGIHEYAFCSVNIFSRPNVISAIIQTDETKFKKRNSLVPPNIKALLIQPESPLILTSALDQKLLADYDTLARVFFQYNHMHERNYDFADKIEFLFRELKPLEIMGGIDAISDFGTQFSMVTTKPYYFGSTQETVIPTISASNLANYKGGILVINGAQFVIEEAFITSGSGNFPKFKIRKNENRQINQVGSNIITTQSWEGPNASNGDLFTATENLSQALSWGSNNPLNFNVQIGDTSWQTIEQIFVDDEGANYSMKLRGIWDSVNVTKISETGTGTIIRVYEIDFQNYALSNHPQYNLNTVDVQWYGGTFRLSQTDATKEWIPYEVMNIVNRKPNSAPEPDNILKLNLEDGNKLKLTIQTINQELRTGNNLNGHFYPGYLVYLYEDTAHDFNVTHLHPTTEDEKTTFLGARSVDSVNACYSDVGTPGRLVAEKIIPPLRPQQPTGGKYATPPDNQNKSTYTFSVQFDHAFFQAVFYRADINSILNALYKRVTIDDIKLKLEPYTLEKFFNNRWEDLLGFNYSNNSTPNAFEEFELSDGSFYALPNPDNPDNPDDPTDTSPYFDGLQKPGDVIEKVKKVMYKVFLPLTEQPLYREFIKEDPYRPIPKKQTVKDKFGKLLMPSDTAFDQAPMAKKWGNRVQFTDFTLSGGMSLNTAYCYFAREIGNKLAMSEPSPIMGPIQLIDKSIPSALQIRKVTTQLANPVLGIPTGVRFEFLKPPKFHRIEKLRIYRTSEAVDALSVRTMTLVKDLKISDLTEVNGVISLVDDFDGEPFIPFGEHLNYRLVGVKLLNYEDIFGNPIVDEEVPSLQTKILQARLVDIFNPAPPEITANVTVSGGQLASVVLSWSPTAYNANYYLYQMTNSGTWQKIYETHSKDSGMSFTLADPLPAEEDDLTLYYRFKVVVKNSSGLLNLNEIIKTISKNN